MKFYSGLNEQSGYNNGVFPDNNTLKSDFEEYKKKEDNKWKLRAQSMGFRYPLFPDFEEFKSALKNADIIKVTDRWINKIANLSDIGNIDDLKSMVKSYKRPRNIEKIIKGFNNNEKIPYPIVLKGDNGYHMMAGNTRINTARIMRIIPKALLVDIGE